MAYFRVEGTSRVSWSLLVEAASEDEASAIACRTAGSQGELRREDALQDVHHEVERPVSLDITAPSNGGQRAHSVASPAAETGQATD